MGSVIHHPGPVPCDAWPERSAMAPCEDGTETDIAVAAEV